MRHGPPTGTAPRSFRSAAANSGTLRWSSTASASTPSKCPITGSVITLSSRAVVPVDPQHLHERARRVGPRYAQSALLEQQCVASRPAADLQHERTAAKGGDQASSSGTTPSGPAVCAR